VEYLDALTSWWLQGQSLGSLTTVNTYLNLKEEEKHGELRGIKHGHLGGSDG